MDVLNRLTEDWVHLENVILYGFGRGFLKNFEKIARDFHIKFIVDNDPQKYGVKFRGIDVIPYKNARNQIGKDKIIIMTESNAYASIAHTLKCDGYREYRDFCKLEDFAVEWYWKFTKQVNIFEIHHAITTRCTLNCRNCNMFIPYHKCKEDILLDELKADLDALFGNIDYVYNFVVLGGEPLIYQNIYDYMRYLVSHYRKQIGQIRIVTNGTVIMTNEMLELAKNENVFINISDYTQQVDYRNRMEKLIQQLRVNHVQYLISTQMRWRDFGFPENPCDYKNVREHMLTCGPIFHGLNDQKIFYCHITWSAEKCGLVKLDSREFIDLSEPYLNKEKIVRYALGDFEKGYLDMCRVCGGCGSDNLTEIDAGIQCKS